MRLRLGLVSLGLLVIGLPSLPAGSASAGPLAASTSVRQVVLPGRGQAAPPLLAVGRDGREWVAWSRNDGAATIGLMGEGSEPTIRPVVTLPHRWVSDLQAVGDGVAVLSGQRADGSAFVSRYDGAGRRLFESTVVTSVPQEYRHVGDRRFLGGRLAWSGTTFATYVAVDQLYGDGVAHQGDVLSLWDAQGRRQRGGWDWGVSHSFGPHVAYDGRRFVSATVGDAYPRGLVIDLHAVGSELGRRVFFRASGEGGDNTVPVRMGDLVAGPRGSVVVFADDDDRPIWRLHDIGMVLVTPDGRSSGKRWITRTDDLDERQPLVGAYGDRLFVVYATRQAGAPKDFVGVVVDWQGQVVAGPEPVDVNDQVPGLVTYPNGDAGWLSVGDVGTTMVKAVQLHRLRVVR